MSSFAAFSGACEAVAATAKKLEKVRVVSEYLCSLPLEEAAIASLFFTGAVFARNQERVLAAGGALAWQAVERLSGASPEAMTAAYRRHGDAGAAAEELLAGRAGDGGLSDRKSVV